MAAIDKTNEFYTCLGRFAFLASCYAPEDLDESMIAALKKIQDYAYQDCVQKRIEEAKEYFSHFEEKWELNNKKELIKYILDH